jgi:hypothetical protein
MDDVAGLHVQTVRTCEKMAPNRAYRTNVGIDLTETATDRGSRFQRERSFCIWARRASRLKQRRQMWLVWTPGAADQNVTDRLSDHNPHVTVQCPVARSMPNMCRSTCTILMQISVERNKDKTLSVSSRLPSHRDPPAGTLTGQSTDRLPPA